MNSSTSSLQIFIKDIKDLSKFIHSHDTFYKVGYWMTNQEKYKANLDDCYPKYYFHVLTNKKEAKMLRKIHEEIVDSYSEQISHLSKKIIQSYANIVSRFLLYSPSVSIEDITPFLMKELDLPKTEGSIKSHLKGTVKKIIMFTRIL